MKTVSTTPKFSPEQKVHFWGGKGTILFCQPNAGDWLSGVEMPREIEPDRVRIGSETRVLIGESELKTESIARIPSN
ncbi:conserved hypothetical protein [Hyella patelloides LEGE 07179]|uniref:Uncharacterized protein n=1 Tax=Hyella patelloides LEGE 07179 TaxID=945734 RepID=A0A563W2G8_9CYAN|nr:hypothetical protein [Hyella patelloides]VEP17878.1 conserved hypothetical protein [Hyella patelloides LEGE 07179]